MPCRDTDHPDVARRPRREAGIPEVAVDVIVNSLPVGSCERFLEGLLLAPALGVTGDCPAGVRRRAAAQVVQAGCPADERPPAILGQVHPGSRDLGFLHVSPHGYSLLAIRVVPLTPAQLVPAHHGRPDDPPGRATGDVGPGRVIGNRGRRCAPRLWLLLAGPNG